MVAGSKRRSIENVKPLTVADLENKLKKMNTRNACLIALLYLSGRRVCEVLHLRKCDILIQKNRVSFETFNEKDYRKKQTADYTIKRFVKRRDFPDRKSIPFEGYVYYRRIRPHFRLNSKSGKRLGVFILNRLGYQDHNEVISYRVDDKELLFKSFRSNNHIGYNMAYKIFRKYFPDHWPHVLRHFRFTELFRVYKNDPMRAHRDTFHKRFESNIPYLRELEKEEELI